MKVSHYYYDLETLNPSQKQWVGEKAIALSQLAQKGEAIVPGIVVGSQVLRSFFEEGSVLSSLSELSGDFYHYETLQYIAQRLSQEIMKISLEGDGIKKLHQTVSQWEAPILILRPSLILPSSQPLASGLIASKWCFPNQEEMELGIKAIWKELLKASSLFYWQKQGINWENLGLAVIIQPLKKARVSGVLEVNSQEWKLQAVRGLGHSLVRGEVLPETYIINANSQAVKSHQLGHQTRVYQPDPMAGLRASETEILKTIISSKELSQLTNFAENLQQTVGQSFDCEWVFGEESCGEEGQQNTSQLYLTQLSVKATMSPKKSSYSLIVKGIGSATGRVTGQIYIPEKDGDQPFPRGGILVTENVTTQTLPLVKVAGGLVTESGGMTSHGAILARELQIPAVVGAKGAIEALDGEKTITVDGDTGEVLRTPEDAKTTGKKEVLATPPKIPHLATQLMVNVSQGDRAPELSRYPIDGVGLLRSDLMLLDLLNQQSLSSWLSSSHRDRFIEELAQLVGGFAQAFFPRPIFYRSTDWLTLHHHDSTLLGERGTYSYLQQSDFLTAQMFALKHLQHQGYYNINLILPFVRSIEEVNFCKTLLKEVGIEESCQMWMMAEIPSVIYLLEEYIEVGIEGIAIGTNDLTQLLLGVDREQGKFRDKYNERHPAVLRMLKQLIEKAQAGKIPCFVCGQGVVLYPDLVDNLVRWGVTGISVEESGIEKVSHSIARSEKRILIEAARKQLKDN